MATERYYPFLVTAYLRVARAREHLADIERRSKVFWDSHEKKISFRLKLETDELIADPPIDFPGLPAMLGVLVGEAVYNLRSALDYLVFDLALFRTRIEQFGTQFPIEDYEDGWRRHVVDGPYLKGLSDEQITAIKRCQPSRRPDFGGEAFSWLGQLRDISNADKHKQWTVVATSLVGNIYWKRGAVGSFGAVSRGEVKRAKLTDGTEVDVHMYGDGAAAITFEDRKSIVLTLEQFISGTTDILDAFKPEFEGREAPGHIPPPAS